MTHIYIIAGETSGDVLGGRLIRALHDKLPDMRLHGIGGTDMAAQELHSLFPMDELSVMGVAEILPRLPKLLRRIKQTANDIIEKQPDIVVTIDSPDFVKRVVKRARPHCPNTKFIHYVAPSVWAWRAGRAKTMAKLYDGLICLLPFEPPYFEREGLRAAFCGHPVIEAIPQSTDQQRDQSSILILPGSRRGEASKLAPIFADAFRRLGGDMHASVVALPHVRDIIEDAFKGIDVTYIDPSSRFDAFQNAAKAMAASGTVGLELAAAGCPHIIGYKMNLLTYWLARRLVKVKYAHLVNIMEGREVIPEFLQQDCTAEALAKGITQIKASDISSVRDKLAGQNPTQTPSQQAADFVISFL